MDLVHGDQPVGLKIEPAAHTGPVFQDMGAVVVRAEADIEATVKPFGHPSGTAEKAMGNSTAC